MEIQVSVHDWLALPMQTRIKLRELFAIPKSKGSLVEGNVVKSDGTTYEDLKAITVVKMQEFLGNEETATPGRDFVQLFNACIEKIAELDKELEVKEDPVAPTAIVLENWTAHLSRMKNESESLKMEDHFALLLTKFIPNVAPTGKSKPRKKAK